MSDGVRTWLTGVGVALAVSLPPTLIAQILDALSDDDLNNPVTVPLSLLVMLGPVAGGWAVGRHRPSRPLLVGAAAGAAALAVVALLGAIRRASAGDDVEPFVVPVMVLWGGVLGAVGSFLGGRTARTRS
ncbi:MAG TPA: TIGR04086 family membrane protein [Acidimicrobiales bacterium]|nr:TIGR04086 family membrane protein [Acidimicrobiales bacterium]